MPIRLLAIDDEELIINLLKDFFAGSREYEVDTAINGEIGLYKIRNKTYDIVITDLNMPGGIDGIEVVRAVKDFNPEIEVIIMTAYGTIETAVEVMKLGAFDFILKPLDFSQIMLVIQKCYQQLSYKRDNKELRELNIKLRELSDEKEKFLMITSHELRTPTNAIVGLASYLYEKISQSSDFEYKKEFQTLLSACDKLVDIVENMYDLSLAKKSRFRLKKRPFNIDDLERDLTMSSKLFLLNRTLDFRYDNELKGEVFRGDFNRIRQAAEALLQNAVKFTQDGGSIKISINKERIDTEDYLTIDVSDTGIGIAKERLGKIFDYFYEIQDSSLHHSSKTEFMGGGIGIGLSLVHEIVKQHGGKIQVRSEINSGSSFKILLPYIERRCKEET